MSSEFPKLSAKLDEILQEFDQILFTKIAKGEIEDVELDISEKNFVHRKPGYSLVDAIINGKKVSCQRYGSKNAKNVKYREKFYKCSSWENGVLVNCKECNSRDC